MSDRWFIAVAAVVTIALFSLAVWAGIEEQKQWNAFAKAHHCNKVAEIAGYYSYGTGVMSNGKVGTVTEWNPSRTTYHCDDGVDYTR